MIQCPQNSFSQKGKPHVTLNVHAPVAANLRTVLITALSAALMAVSVLAAGCAPAAGQDNPAGPRSQAVILRMAETMPENHPSARAMAHFAEMVSREIPVFSVVNITGACWRLPGTRVEKEY